MPVGIVLAATPVRSQALAVPRFLHPARYDAMERHFDSVGPAGGVAH
jgi:glutamate--cysteine ligase